MGSREELLRGFTPNIAFSSPSPPTPDASPAPVPLTELIWVRSAVAWRFASEMKGLLEVLEDTLVEAEAEVGLKKLPEKGASVMYKIRQ